MGTLTLRLNTRLPVERGLAYLGLPPGQACVVSSSYGRRLPLLEQGRGRAEVRQGGTPRGRHAQQQGYSGAATHAHTGPSQAEGECRELSAGTVQHGHTAASEDDPARSGPTTASQHTATRDRRSFSQSHTIGKRRRYKLG